MILCDGVFPVMWCQMALAACMQAAICRTNNRSREGICNFACLGYFQQLSLESSLSGACVMMMMMMMKQLGKSR